MPSVGTLGWAYTSSSAVSIASGIADQQIAFMPGSKTLSGSTRLTYDPSSQQEKFGALRDADPNDADVDLSAFGL